MSENNNLFIYTRQNNESGNICVEKYPIVPFFPLISLGEKFYLQTNDTCKLRIFWQGYFGLATEHNDDIPIRWDGTRSTELQSIGTYTELRNNISEMPVLRPKPELKSGIFPADFLTLNTSFHRIIINLIGQRDYLTDGLSDEPYDANLITEFLKNTGYDAEQLVSEEKLYHNDHINHEQFRNNTYVWFDNSNYNSCRNPVVSLQCFFEKRWDYIKTALEGANLKPTRGLYDFSNENNRSSVRTVLTNAGINVDSFDLVFNDYNDRLSLTGSIDDINEFIQDFAKYLTFQDFCGNYILSLGSKLPLELYGQRAAEGMNSLYLLQLIFTQITLDHLDEPAEIRRQIFDSILKIRHYLSNHAGYGYYLKEGMEGLSGREGDIYKFFSAYKPTENPIQYIANSILPKNLRMTGEKFESFLEHINYIYTALTNLSVDDSVTRLTLWTIPPDLDKKFGFIRDGVFCRTLFDVVEKYNSFMEPKILADDLKKPPQEYEIVQEAKKLTQNQIQNTMILVRPIRRRGIKISGITSAVFGFLAMMLGISAQAVSFGIPNPVSIALIATGFVFITAGGVALGYRFFKNNQEETSELDLRCDNVIQSNIDNINIAHEDGTYFLNQERIENAQVGAINLPENQEQVPPQQTSEEPITNNNRSD